MKIFLQTLILSLFISNISFAQPSSGTIFVGGNVGLSIESNKTKNDNTTTKNYSVFNYSILPQAGYFINDVIAVGAGIGLSGNSANYEDNYSYDKITRNSFVINPFARYYLINQKGGFFVEAESSISIGKNKTIYENTTSENNLTNIFMGISPGVYYYILDNIVLQAFFGSFGYRSSITKNNDDIKTTTNSLGFNLNSNSFSFGFAYEF